MNLQVKKSNLRKIDYEDKVILCEFLKAELENIFSREELKNFILATTDIDIWKENEYIEPYKGRLKIVDLFFARESPESTKKLYVNFVKEFKERLEKKVKRR